MIVKVTDGINLTGKHVKLGKSKNAIFESLVQICEKRAKTHDGISQTKQVWNEKDKTLLVETYLIFDGGTQEIGYWIIENNSVTLVWFFNTKFLEVPLVVRRILKKHYLILKCKVNYGERIKKAYY